MKFEYIPKNETSHHVDIDENCLEDFIRKHCALNLLNAKSSAVVYPKMVFDAAEFGIEPLTDIESGIEVDSVELIACANGDCQIQFYSSYDDFDIYRIDIPYCIKPEKLEIEILRSEFDE